jgi:hypothetical protein
MKTKEAIDTASLHLRSLQGHIFDVLTVTKPISPNAGANLAKVISKLSPLLGNMIEFNVVEYLNDKGDFSDFGTWIRQDPGFPDAILDGTIQPTPGFEIKAWFPLATEITARFKDSQNHFADDQTYVAMLAWLPEQLIYGRPKIVDVCIVSGKSVAEARDSHYHNPPDYLVLEPEDTSARTRNLQQTNTNGYKWQGSETQFVEAKRIVEEWGSSGTSYKPTREYQEKLRDLIARYPYRLDTNFAKMDRIVHTEIEGFKSRVYDTKIHGKTVGEWGRLFIRGDDSEIKSALQKYLNITDQDADQLLK